MIYAERQEMNNNMQPVVSIITPTYNILESGRKESLVKTIQSVRKQTYGKIEHLIIDGGSNDGTLEFLNEIGEGLRIISEPDKGLYDAMNKGVRNACGEFILILNSDDSFIDDKAIEVSVNAIIESGADFSYAKARCVDAYGMETPMPNCYAPDIEHIFLEMTISHQTMLCKKALYKNCEFSLEYEIGSDYKWVLEMCMLGAVPVYVDKFIVEYHRGGKSDRIKNYHKYIDERVAIFYDVFSKYNHEVTKYMCETIFFDQFIDEFVWETIQSHVKFNVKRHYLKKYVDTVEARVTETRYMAAKNTMLLKLFLNYTNQLIRGNSLANILREKGYNDCAIYGYGNIGQSVYLDLMKNGFEVKYIVDMNANEFIGEDSLSVDILSLSDIWPRVDLIIVTPVFFYDDIYKLIRSKVESEICALDDLIQP